jgi:hypothetical protein
MITGRTNGIKGDPMTNKQSRLLFKYSDKESRLLVVFEDDGRVAFAYLVEGDKILADVWLYNHGRAPAKPEWRDVSKAPFKNSSKFASRRSFRPVTDPKEVAIVWKWKDQQQLDLVEVYLRGKLHGVLIPSVKPGWSLLAVEDGPLAKVLHPKLTSKSGK